MTTTFRRFGRHIPVVLVALFAVSCGSNDEHPSKDLVTFPLKGEVVKIDRENRRLSVAHEEIPGYMDAMTMSFKVKDSTVFEMVSVGDSITATLAVSRVESWLDGVTVVGTGDAGYRSPEDVMFRQLYKTGETLPPLAFVNQENKPFFFSSLRGRAVAVTFIYTRCPLPDFCILMSSNFFRVQEILKNEKTLAGLWHLVTVSFDPKNDTPEVLKRYARQYNADLAVSDYVAADKKTIDAFATGFDLYVASGEGGLIDHTLRTVLLDKEGKLVSIIKGNSWTPEELSAELKRLSQE